MNKDKSNNALILILGSLLMVAVFFVGRLSLQVDLLKDGEKVKGVDVEVVDSGEAELSPLSVSELKLTAVDLGLDAEEFNRCLDEGDYEEQVKGDAELAFSLGINGTPVFVINGWVLTGSRQASFYEDVIEAELAGGAGDLLDEILGEDEVKKVEVELRGEHLKGEIGAAVEIVEFSDFECSFCTDVYPVMKGVLEKYGDKVVFEYRHLPLGFHAYAQKAAEAVECAGAQGKFWEMHDALFEAGL